MQIINANLDLVSRSVEPAADKEALEENKRIVRQLDLAASLRTWLALQGHVNSLLDSSTASQADVSVSPFLPASSWLCCLPHTVLCSKQCPWRERPCRLRTSVYGCMYTGEPCPLWRAIPAMTDRLLTSTRYKC